MNQTIRSATWSARRRQLALAAATALALCAGLLDCTVGTPAAPEGTEIPLSHRYITQNLVTGDFEAVINATVIDTASDVPQVGVGVYFRVSGGSGHMTDEGPIVTNHAGHAESVLVAFRALDSAHAVTVDVSSGATTAKILLTVNDGTTVPGQAPVAAFTMSPDPPRNAADVTVDVATSTSDCTSHKPETWKIDWLDGSAITQGRFTTGTTATHRYAGAAGATWKIDVTVTDCTGLSNTKHREGTLG